MSLFEKKDFISHSGLELKWKINCDALSTEDIKTLAWLIGDKLDFGDVVGIPMGGVRLAEAVRQYTAPAVTGIRLIVDDVWTTGNSMNKYLREFPNSIGVVIFARSPCPYNVYSVFECSDFWSIP